MSVNSHWHDELWSSIYRDRWRCNRGYYGNTTQKNMLSNINSSLLHEHLIQSLWYRKWRLQSIFFFSRKIPYFYGLKRSLFPSYLWWTVWVRNRTTAKRIFPDILMWKGMRGISRCIFEATNRPCMALGKVINRMGCFYPNGLVAV